MANPRVTLNGNRAICEYSLILYQRKKIDGYDFDLQTWSTCLDQFERHEIE